MRNAERERRWAARAQKIGEFVDVLEEGPGLTGLGDCELREIRVKWSGGDGSDVLLVVKASGASGEWVGFAGGLGFGQAILKWRALAQGAGLRWRADRPWTPEAGEGQGGS